MAASVKKKRVGVLALQGDFQAHERALARAGAEAVEVRSAEDLEGIQGLVIPGGESTHHDEAAPRRKAAGSIARVWTPASDLWNVRGSHPAGHRRCQFRSSRRSG